MSPAYVTSVLANHLWQSTVVAALAGLLALALRANQARTRYWLWMIASVKFLIPFSLLVVAGSYLRPVAPAPVPKPAVSAVLEQITQPFSRAPSSSVAVPAVIEPRILAHNESLLPVILLSLWACGFLIVAFSWWRKWRTIRAAVRAASRLALVADVPVRSSTSLLEPGVFGIIQPVLLLPEGITDGLTAAQLQTVIAHEMSHVRRRDNLTAAIHMLVQAVFWFHPIVWWIGTRLVEERERACDEAVLQSGNEAHVYAEGILNVCKFYFESPLACVSGVTGADLKKRIVRIVNAQRVRKLDFQRKFLLGLAGLLSVAVPVAFGLMQTASKAPDIAGIWQGTLATPGKSLRLVLKVSKADDGAWKAISYSIDQGGQPIPVSTITLQGSTVKYSIMMIDGSFEGKLSPDGASIAGTWTQGSSLPLTYARVTPDTAWAIPEPPPRLPPMAADANPEFEVATIKPSKPDTPGKMFRVNVRHFSTLNTTLDDLIIFAYGIHVRQIIDGPAWFGSDKYDLDAQPDGQGQPNEKQWKTMVQKLLADRFKLAFHRDKKELSAYALVVGKNGPKLTKSQGEPNGLPGLMFRGPGIFHASNATMANFAGILQGAVLDRPVVDQTGLEGKYDFPLKWTPDESQFASFDRKMPPLSDNADAPPGLFTAIQEQLGLKLESTKAPVEVLVIDHVEKPSEN
jgi:uncharacterized protein (TIGR03435 family)